MANKELARVLRKRQTDAERLLWYWLRNRRFSGYKFRRQQVLGRYIVDFVCLAPRLIIELDGGQHGLQVDHDAERSRALGKLGFKVLRFWNNEVLEETDSVLETILLELRTFPLPQGEGQGKGVSKQL